MSRPRVFVTRRLPEVARKIISAFADVEEWQHDHAPAYDELLRKTKDCSGLLCLLSDRIDRNLLIEAKKLKVVANYAVGFDNIDVDAATELGIAVGNTPDVLTDATADLAAGLLLNAARNLQPAYDSVRLGHWQQWEPLGHLGTDLMGKTLGIYGMGRIGAAFAERMAYGWNMQVIYYSRERKPEIERRIRARHVDVGTLLAESDFLSVHCALSAETKGKFDAEAFAAMKPGSIFINTARGEVQVDKDLAKALRDGPLAAAAVDVCDPEPMDPDHELLQLPNFFITPHIGSATRQTRERMAVIAAENIVAGIKGRPLRAWVNPSVSN